jgi:hypothetical protein
MMIKVLLSGMPKWLKDLVFNELKPLFLKHLLNMVCMIFSGILNMILEHLLNKFLLL